MSFSRRIFLRNGLLASLTAGLSTAIAQSLAQAQAVDCLLLPSEKTVTAESKNSPFFEHFHQIRIPVKALIRPPTKGILVKTSPVDQGSYDLEGFKKFISSTGLNAKLLRQHDHEVKVTREQLLRIARGEKAVEIQVISKNGNYVHNFLITAPPSVLAMIRKIRT